MAASSSWKRPAEVPLPTIWARFRGLKPLPDGRVPEFWVQDVPDDLLEATLNLMVDHFTLDSAFSRALNIREDPLSMEETRENWRRHLEMRVSLVALTEGEDGKPVIAGCNLLTVVSDDDPPLPEARGVARRVIDESLEAQERRTPVRQQFGERRALSASGMLVRRAFRRQGVGLQLLLARDPLCRALGLPLTYTVFSSEAAQAMAEKAGFHCVDEQSFADYRDAEGRAVLASSEHPSFKLMVKRIPPEGSGVAAASRP